MAVIIDATVGGATANSYVTLTEANNYFANRLYATTYINATEDDRARALIMATQRIDFEAYSGNRASPTQALKFPRIGLPPIDGIYYSHMEIPPQIKIATFELALHMLNTDMSAANTNAAYNSVQVGPLSVDFASRPPSNNSMPPYVIRLLAPFIEINFGTIELRRG